VSTNLIYPNAGTSVQNIAARRLYSDLAEAQALASSTAVLIWKTYGVSSKEGRACERILGRFAELLLECERVAEDLSERLPTLQLAYSQRHSWIPDEIPHGHKLAHRIEPDTHWLVASNLKLLSRDLHSARVRMRIATSTVSRATTGTAATRAEKQIARLRTLLHQRLVSEHPKLDPGWVRRCYEESRTPKIARVIPFNRTGRKSS